MTVECRDLCLTFECYLEYCSKSCYGRAADRWITRILSYYKLKSTQPSTLLGSVYECQPYGWVLL